MQLVSVDVQRKRQQEVDEAVKRTEVDQLVDCLPPYARTIVKIS